MPNIDRIIINGTSYDIADMGARGDVSTALTNADAAMRIAQNAVSYAEAQTLTDTQKVTARSNIGAASADDVDTLEDSLNGVTERAEAAYVTDNLSSMGSIGVTYENVDGTVKMYGTATASRRACFLNGQAIEKITTSPFSKTLDAGTYLIEAQATGVFSNFRFVGTYTTFNDLMWVVTYTQPTVVVTFTAPVMIGLLVVDGNNYGTEADPTYISFSAKRLTAVDMIAREEADKTKNAVLYSAQPLTDEQMAQARENIDGVGNDTLYSYNFYDVFALSTEASGSRNGVDYTRNPDGSWTINGTATALSFKNLVNSTNAIPRYIIPGRKYRCSFNGGTIAIQIFIYQNGAYISNETFHDDFDYTFPANMDGLIIRFLVPNGVTVNNETVKYTFVPETVTSIDNRYTYNITVDQTVQQINNTYDLDVSPTITTDAHGWLQAVDTNTADETGKTDMTPAIMAMLNATGYCHLGEGVYYVSGNIDMPAQSTLRGCGRKTVIRLLSSVEAGYCIKLENSNTLSDLMVSGAYNALSPTEQGTRTGILFAANDDGQEGATARDTFLCMMSNVRVINFSDSGVKCHNSSMSVARGLYAMNVYATQCWCGVNIDYRSEFNKFVNLCTNDCAYGCINNGGNNVFTSCTFGANSVGLYIDGTKYNSGHGTINGCTFCHIGSNTGSAITIENTSNGFVISNSQIWYCSVDISNSSGVLFDGCEFGRGIRENKGATINISGGNLVMFVGCVFMSDQSYPPDITVTNNSKVKFNACYGSATGNAVTA